MSSYVIAFHEKMADRQRALQDVNSQLFLREKDTILATFQKTVLNALPSSTLNCTNDPDYDQQNCLLKKVTMGSKYSWLKK